MDNRPPSKQQQILDTVNRIETVVVGVPGTDDRGMAGSIKEMKSDHKALSGIVGQHSAVIARLAAFHEGDGQGMSAKKKVGIWGAIGSTIAGVIYGLIQLFKSTPT